MGRTKNKRKRDHEQATGDAPLTKKGKGAPSTSKSISHPLLSLLYPHIQTLRDYVLSRLPASSRLRRKKIASVGLQSEESRTAPTEVELAVARLLDTTVVSFSHQPPKAEQDDRWRKWNSFSQKGDESYVTLSDGFTGAAFSQTEVVDFAIWLLFSRDKSNERPKNLLCDGLRRDSTRKPQGKATATQGQIPGLFAVYTNNHVRTLKQDPWPQLLLLLGQAGERMMIDLLLDCSIFSRVGAGRDNYQQLSGIPVSDLDYPDTQLADAAQASTAKKGKRQAETARTPSEITFVRSRMLYARAALNARGLVHFGLRHIRKLCPQPP
ncbi:hypothetical protein GE09DRAFT_420893 [Coniochaeta sp. 2T2.1]|nr:hypothetical protein GE09DRAFT_420893 [Coniochaeta sp. 2T2.1]